MVKKKLDVSIRSKENKIDKQIKLTQKLIEFYNLTNRYEMLK